MYVEFWKRITADTFDAFTLCVVPATGHEHVVHIGFAERFKGAIDMSKPLPLEATVT
jgi:hypothetical protein